MQFQRFDEGRLELSALLDWLSWPPRLPLPGFFPDRLSAGVALSRDPAGRGTSMTVKNQSFYEAQAEGELRLAAQAVSLEERKIHLNQAAEFATMAERLLKLQVPI